MPKAHRKQRLARQIKRPGKIKSGVYNFIYDRIGRYRKISVKESKSNQCITEGKKQEAYGKNAVFPEFCKCENYIYDKDAYFLGFKYGPNARLFRLFAEYIDKPFEITMAAELLTRGEYGIESFYGDRDKLDEMGVIDMLKLAGAKTSVLLFETDFAYYLQDSLKIVADLDLQFDFTHKKNAYKIGIGFSCNPLTTDWKNLF